MVPGTPASAIAEWAIAGEESGFASLAVGDRVVYSNYDALLSIAVAASVTERVQLYASVLLGPLRPPHVLVKEAATLDRISEGRFSLGLGVGSRPNDYQATQADFAARGSALDAQAEALTSGWREDSGPVAGIGPAPRTPGGPVLLFGGSSRAAWRRISRYGAGWICGQGGPAQFEAKAEELGRVWKEQGREGEPRRMAMIYFAVGPAAEASAAKFINSYYAFAPFREALLAATPTSREQIAKLAAAYSAAGCDELMLFPTSPSLDQVKLLASVLPHAHA
jgi:alkanesulfonate monooxygenase SsuD/methylene tetrahydromethanopterin reductase-like flavin-dependent oxidoreductase (luciferase family)